MDVIWIALIVFVAIGIGLGVWRALDEWYGELLDFIMLGFFGALAGLLAWSITIVVLLFVGPVSDKTWEVDLRSIGTSDSINGSFFLGSGTVDGERVFNYTYKTDDGGTKIGSVEADKGIVYEDATAETAHILQEYGYRNAWFFGDETSFYFTYDRWNIHIPAGSVYEGYEVK
jgi:hypothetical protein